MAIARESNGDVTLNCDTCSDYIETEQNQLEEALEVAKTNGWHIMKIANDWKHVCPECYRKL